MNRLDYFESINDLRRGGDAKMALRVFYFPEPDHNLERQRTTKRSCEELASPGVSE